MNRISAKQNWTGENVESGDEYSDEKISEEIIKSPELSKVEKLEAADQLERVVRIIRRHCNSGSDDVFSFEA